MPTGFARIFNHFRRIEDAVEVWADDVPVPLRDRFRSECSTLKDRRDASGEEAVDALGRYAEFRKHVFESTVRMLYYRRKHWPHTMPQNSRFARAVAAGRADWAELEFGIDRFAGHGPGITDISMYPHVTGNLLADRIIGRIAMEYADGYDDHLIATEDQIRRKSQHEKLSALHDDKSGNFAQNGDRSKRAGLLRTLRLLRDIEVIRVQQYVPPRVQTRDISLLTTNERNEMFRVLSKMTTLGRWRDQGSPLHTVAAARAIYHGGRVGYAFTVNLSLKVRWSARAAQKPFNSHIQDRVRKALKTEFGKPVDFYFVLENALGERPHIHGAIDLEHSDETRRRIRKALYKIAGGWVARSPGRKHVIHTKELYTPARWANYVFKRDASVRARLGVLNQLCMTNPLKRRAKDQWELMRCEQREAKRAQTS